MWAVAVAPCLIAVLLGPAAAAECVVDQYYVVFGSDVQVNMKAKSGIPCTAGFDIKGGGLNAMTVAQQAQHGTAAVAGLHKWGYRSTPGYVGHDRFVIQVSGQAMRRRVFAGESKISVEVNVAP